MPAKLPDTANVKSLQGWRYFRALLPLLARLHDAGCARDKASNRKLHFDQYCAFILLALFNPLAQVAHIIVNKRCTARCFPWFFEGWVETVFTTKRGRDSNVPALP